MTKSLLTLMATPKVVGTDQSYALLSTIRRDPSGLQLTGTRRLYETMAVPYGEDPTTGKLIELSHSLQYQERGVSPVILHLGAITEFCSKGYIPLRHRAL